LENQISQELRYPSQVEILDPQGKMVAQFENLEGNKSFPLNLKPGLYFLKINNLKETRMDKMVLIK
jgi:hypothetical protein